jgi:hypothetical protein
MPIRPENKDRYPKDWHQISKAVRERAGNACEACGAPNGTDILRGVEFENRPAYAVPCGFGATTFDAESGERLAVRVLKDLVRSGWREVRVVLTVAHLDHQPENCDPANLQAWCQRCHNAYDAPMRRAGIAARARNAKAVGDLFAEVDQ